MKYTVSASDDRFAYLQLYEQLRRDIVSGLLPLGSKLPSKRLLAEETGTSVITVEHTYSILCDEGYAESRPRSGYYVIYRETDFLSSETDASLPVGPEDPPLPLPAVSSETLGQNSEKSDFSFSVLARTMRRVLSERGESILIKSPNQGCPELRGSIAGYLARSSGIRVTPEQIVIGSGAEYLYSLIAQLLREHLIFGLEHPSHTKIRQVYQAHRIDCQMLELGPDGIRTSQLEKTAATVLHVTPFHSFPSGVTAGASKRQEYLRWAEKRGGYIVEDNYDSELTVSKKNEDTLFSLSRAGRVLYLNTFSGTVSHSMRIGYLVLPEQLVEEFQQRLGFYSCTVPVFEQYVLAELIDSGDFERHINRIRRARRRAGHP